MNRLEAVIDEMAQRVNKLNVAGRGLTELERCEIDVLTKWGRKLADLDPAKWHDPLTPVEATISVIGGSDTLTSEVDEPEAPQLDDGWGVHGDAAD